MREAGRIRAGGRLALAMVLGVTAGGAAAAPFQIELGAEGSVWVLDAASGALDWCRLEPKAGPKVVDVDAFGAEARSGISRAAEPECIAAMAPQPASERLVLPVALVRERVLHEDGYYFDGGLRYSEITARPLPPVSTLGRNPGPRIARGMGR
jgi:hypothetical protein